MKRKSTKILSLFARGKEIGFVVMEDGEILRYGVKTIKGKRRGSAFAKRVEKVLSLILKAVEPQGLVVLERNSSLSKRGTLCQAIAKTSKFWKAEGHPLHFISLREVKKSLCDNRKATHRELIEKIVGRYPLLWSLSLIHKPEKAKYWQKVLIAMALAETAKKTNDRLMII